MKSLFQTGTREEYLNILVFMLRVSIAAFMLTHGWPKLGKLLAGGEIQFGDPIGLGPGFSLILSGRRKWPSYTFCFISYSSLQEVTNTPLIIS